MKMRELQKLLQALPVPATSDQQEMIMEYLQSLGFDLSNTYQELEMESVYVDTHRDASYANAALQLHSHDFYEILCCTSNCNVEYLVGPRRYRLQKGDIVVVPPSVSHRPILPENMREPYLRNVLWISNRFMELLCQFSSDFPIDNDRNTDLLRTAGTQWEFLPELIHRGVTESESRLLNWEAAVIGNTVTVLTHLDRAFRDRNTIPLSAEKPELLDQVMAYVERYYAQPISLSFIARTFYVSSSTISHLFQLKLGVSFHRYVTQRRLIAAKDRIARGELLENVSQAVGFTDYSAFYRAFKGEYGISPRQYRQL